MVWAVRVALFCVLVTMTEAPASMAPLASVTRPVICPKVWANDGIADASNTLKPRIQANVLRMKSLLLSFIGSGGAKAQLGTLIGANSYQRCADVSTKKS